MPKEIGWFLIFQSVACGEESSSLNEHVLNKSEKFRM